MVDRISPLDALVVPGVYGADTTNPGVTLSEDLATSLVQVAAWPDTREAVEKILSSLKGATTMATGPGRWLIESDHDDLEAKLRKKVPSKIGSVTGLTHGRVVVAVSGEKAAWLLATGVALDFHVSAFPVGATKVSRHHDIGLTIRRDSETEFVLYAFTSFAHGLWHWLTEAAGEAGYRVN